MKNKLGPLMGRKRWLLALGLIGTAGTHIQAQDGALDHSYTADHAYTRNIYAAAQLASGRVLVGGDMTIESPGTPGGYLYGGIAFLEADGSVDRMVHTGGMFGEGGTVGQVWSIREQPDGKVLVAGGFRNYGEEGWSNIVRIEADGSVDPDFNIGAGAQPMSGSPLSPIYAVHIQADGKIVVGGMFDQFDGAPRRSLARLNADGSLDPGFQVGAGVGYSGTSVPGAVWTLTGQPDGRLILSGLFGTYDGTAVKGLIRVHADGSLDTGFDTGTGPNSLVRAVAVQPDGKVLITGQFTTYDGEPVAGIARLEPDGSLDPSFQVGTGFAGLAGPDVGGAALLLQHDGKIVVGGWFNSYNGVPRNNILRLNADGSLDHSFDPGSGVTVYPGAGNEQPRVRCLLPLTGNRLLVGGVFGKYDGVPRKSLAAVVNHGPVGIEEVVAEEQPTVSPNPFTDRVNVALPASERQVPYTVHNALGAQVAGGTMAAWQQGLSLGHLPSGVYLLRLAGSPQGYRLVKE